MSKELNQNAQVNTNTGIVDKEDLKRQNTILESFYEEDMDHSEIDPVRSPQVKNQDSVDSRKDSMSVSP